MTDIVFADQPIYQTLPTTPINSEGLDMNNSLQKMWSENTMQNQKAFMNNNYMLDPMAQNFNHYISKKSCLVPTSSTIQSLYSIFVTLSLKAAQC